MQRAYAIALCLLGIAFPACAQHGGGHAGGHAGFGGASHGSFSSRPAFSGSSSRSFAPSRFASGVPYSRFSRYGSPASMPANRYAARPEYNGAYAANRPANNGYGDHRQRYRPAYTSGYGYPGYAYPYLGWGDPYLSDPYLSDDSDDTGYGDTTAYPNGPSDGAYDQGYDQRGYDPAYAQGAANGGYGAQPPYQGSYGQGPYGQAPNQGPYSGPYQGQYPAPPASYQARPTPAPSAAAPASESGAAITLVFKDGRPQQQIHNYILSRTTLSVLDPHPRDIPVDDLDLAATEKANRDAGVDFRLPDASR